MCRMLAAPRGVLGESLIGPFLKMAEGRNTLNEHNTALGTWRHADGWGVVFDRGYGLEVHRSPLACWDDPELEWFRSARVFFLHARKASFGAVRRSNVQPFDRETNGGRWFFGHNGTVRDPLPDVREGGTDSEWLFQAALGHGLDASPLEALRSVYGRVTDYTSLNTLLLGPEEFWAVCLWSLDPSYYSLVYADTKLGPMVASEPLFDLHSEWHAIGNGMALRIDRRFGKAQRRDFLPPAIDDRA